MTEYHEPGGHGIRIDTHVYAGYTIPPHYDSMVAKLITVAQTRSEAITKMERALSEYIVEGVKTTIPFHQQLMQDENFRAGNFTTKFLEDFVLNRECFLRGFLRLNGGQLQSSRADLQGERAFLQNLSEVFHA